jgi:hypothetical protein
VRECSERERGLEREVFYDRVRARVFDADSHSMLFPACKTMQDGVLGLNPFRYTPMNLYEI